MKRTTVALLLLIPALVAAGVLAHGRDASAPSPGTPGEGRGGGDPASIQNQKSKIKNAKDPRPNPPPEYGERGKGEPATSPALPGMRFGHVDVFLDSTGGPLAAWQCEIAATAGDVTLVGIEGGEHPAFSQPPYYDPKALGQNRIILGAFNTGADLPRGSTRVARLMVQIMGPARPAFEATVQVAAGPDGKPTPTTISVSDPDSEGAQR